MNRLILLFILSLFVIVGYGQKAETTVRSFAANMEAWAQTDNLSYQKNIVKLSKGEKNPRVADQIAMELGVKNNMQPYNGSFELETYLNCIAKEIEKGIQIKYSNFQYIPISEISVSDPKGLEFIACEVTMTGSVNYNVKDLFYIRNGKVTKIDKYEEILDKGSRKKVLVDLSDLENEATFGLSYNYSKNFPLGVSLNATWSWFMCSLDIGVNKTKKDLQHVETLNVVDIVNYTIESCDYDPKLFMTLTPSFYYKYFSVGCGFGFLYMRGNKTTIYKKISEKEVTDFVNGDANSLNIGASNGVGNDIRCKFMIRPSVKTFIKVSQNCSLSLSVGYDYIYGYKNLSGINGGIGFQWTCDYNWLSDIFKF